MESEWCSNGVRMVLEWAPLPGRGGGGGGGEGGGKGGKRGGGGRRTFRGPFEHHWDSIRTPFGLAPILGGGGLVEGFRHQPLVRQGNDLPCNAVSRGASSTASLALQPCGVGPYTLSELLNQLLKF